MSHTMRGLQQILNLSILIITLCPLDTLCTASIPGVLTEYCQDRKFAATCPDQNSIILMTEANFGRMRIGKCVQQDMGYLGKCQKNVLRRMDSKCSGHLSCEVSIMDSILRDVQPCSKEVTWHLEASYDCIPLSTGNSMQCMSGRPMTLTAPSGYLGSAASSTGTGTARCPYRLEAEPGQQFNISVYNFNYKGDNHCREIASAWDGGSSQGVKRPITVCSRQSRVSITMVSTSNIVDIHFSSSLQSSDIQYLLQYEIIGCGSYKLPPGSYADRKGNKMTIHCNKTDQSWTLHCQDKRWFGGVGNCTHVANGANDWSVDDIFGDDSNFPYGILIVVAVGVALGIFLGGSLLFLASIYIRRKRQRYLNRNIPDCVLTSQHDTQMIRGEDALCLDGKPYLDSDYDPCEFRTPQHMRSTLPAQTPREAIIIQKTSSGKTDSSHVTCMSSVPQLDGNTTIHSKGSFGSTHVHYGSSAKPCQHHYESPSFS